MKGRKEWRYAVLFIAPAFFIYTVFVVIPMLQAFYYALLKWNGLTRPQWVGLQNFADALRHELFWTALSHNIFLLVAAGSVTLGLALGLAALLHARVWGTPLFRATFFFPNMIASVAVALLWILLYSPSAFGVVNAALVGIRDAFVALGLPWYGPEPPVAFLESRTLIPSLVPMLVWVGTGFYLVLFLAAMESIPHEYYEAAVLDGTTRRQQFLYITVPLIGSTLLTAAIFFGMGVLKLFDPIWVMENQRPNRDSHTLATLLYQKAFTEYNIGFAAAIAVLLFLLIFLGTWFTLRLSRRQQLEY